MRRAGPGAAGLVAAGLVAAVFSSLTLTACAPGPNTVYVTMEAYISAVSLNDVSRILATSAPYQRELMSASTPEQQAALGKKYRDLIEGGYMLWESAKSAGQLSPDPLGVALIRAIGLGREGGAAFPVRVRFEDDNTRAIIESRAITNYDSIKWDRLPSGGRIFLMGYPFGKVVNYAPGYDDPYALQLLATVDIEWTMVRIPGLKRPAEAPSDWYVDKIEPKTASATAWSPKPTAEP